MASWIWKTGTGKINIDCWNTYITVHNLFHHVELNYFEKEDELRLASINYKYSAMGEEKHIFIYSTALFLISYTAADNGELSSLYKLKYCT